MSSRSHFRAAFQPARCGLCQEILAPGSETIRTRDNTRYHPKCFRCSHCDTELTSGVSASYYEKDGALFCAEDFRVLHGKDCDICAAKLLRWHTRGTQIYCPDHEGTFPQCLGCTRLTPPGDCGAQLDDGRFACQRCSATPVVDLQVARRLYDRVHAFLSQAGVCVPAASEVELELHL